MFQSSQSLLVNVLSFSTVMFSSKTNKLRNVQRHKTEIKLGIQMEETVQSNEQASTQVVFSAPNTLIYVVT